MDNSISFSILIPSYKSRYMKEAIDSCLNQTYVNFNIIIVDDASPENLKAIIEGYTDNRIMYFRNKSNCGAENVVKNWNICLSHSISDYVICMGDDDVLSPYALEEYASLIKKYPHVHLFHSRTITIDPNSEYMEIMEQRPEFETQLSFLRRRLEGRPQYIGDFCFNRCYLVNLGGFQNLPLAWCADDLVTFMCADAGVVNTSKATFFYRVHPTNISSLGNPLLKIDAINMLRSWVHNFLQDYCPENNEDEQEKKYIEKNVDGNLNKRISAVIGADIKANITKVFYWIAKRKKHNISNKTLLLGLLYSRI